MNHRTLSRVCVAGSALAVAGAVSAQDFAVSWDSTGQGTAIAPIDGGTLGQATFWPAYDGWTTLSGDFDGDGDSDIIWQQRDIGHVIYGEVQDAKVVKRTYLTWLPGHVLTTADFNGDGKDDLLIQHAAFSNAGLPTFQAAVWLMDGPMRTQSTPLGVLQGFFGFPGDFDGDGTSDLLLRDPLSQVLVRPFANGAPTGTNVISWQPDRPSIPVDLTGNGTDDILLLDETTGQYFAFIMSGGVRDSVAVYPNWPNRTPFGVGDFNGDGHPDLALYDGVTEVVHVHIYTQAGGSPDMTGSPGSISDPENFEWFIVDFDGDGNDDFVIFDNAQGIVKAWLMDGPVLKQSVLIGTFDPNWMSPTLLKR